MNIPTPTINNGKRPDNCREIKFAVVLDVLPCGEINNLDEINRLFEDKLKELYHENRDLIWSWDSQVIGEEMHGC